MTKTKHTPGPWKVVRDDDGEIRILHGASQVVSVGYPEESPEGESSANARLIAAAPDLLSAAKTMVSAWDNFIATEDGLDGMDSCATQVVKLRAAIAKAEGQP